MKNKVIKLEELLPIVIQLKKKGKTIVVQNGSFDLLHVGHIKGFKEAKKQGDVLIILLNSDVSVAKYKGPFRPIITENERAIMVASLEMVDYIVIFDEIHPKNILAQIKPDIYCVGTDWGKNGLSRKVIEDLGGKIHVLKWKDGISTSRIINKIFNVSKKEDVKAVFLDRDGVINEDEKNNYVHTSDKFVLLPGVKTALKKLSLTKYKIIIVTNQMGIGIGRYSEEDFIKLNNWMLNKFAEEKIRIDKVYYCPHLINYDCDCRKPNLGMFIKAVKEFGINLSKSWLVGDKVADVTAGREAGIKTIKIGEKIPEDLKLGPHYYVSDLQQAVNIILGFKI